MDIKKALLMLLVVLIIFTSFSAVSAGLFDGLFGGGNDENVNITLIKEFTEGVRCIYEDDGSVNTYYTIKGVFKGLPKNVEEYNLIISLYDKNGKLMKKDDGYTMRGIAKSSKNSEVSTLGQISTYDNKIRDAKYIGLTIYDDEGKIVFDKNITFTIENLETNYLTIEEDHPNDTSSSSSLSSSSSSNNKFNNYIGNAATGKFHSSSCHDVGKMDPSNMVFFSSRDDAINHGYEPCGHCGP